MVDERTELRLNTTLFMQVQHRVFMDGKLGPLHKHSCSVEVEVVPPTDTTIPFSELESLVRDQVGPYDGHTLNELEEFWGINPSIENLAQRLHALIGRALEERGAALVSLSIKESPTRTVKIVRAHTDSTARAGLGEPLGALPETRSGRPDADFDPDATVDTSWSWSKRESLFIDPTSIGVLVSDASTDETQEYAESGRIGMDVVLQPLEPLLRRLPIFNLAAVLAKVSPPTYSTLLVWLALGVLCAVIYGNLLWPSAYAHYPWGSDTWGHVAKSEFLLQEVARGNWFPVFSPAWYNGIEPFRYWAPLPYYVLSSLMLFWSEPFRAAGAYVAICAFVGGAGWLLQKQRIGSVPAVLCAALWMIWPDHVRVAMSEGNLPRALATAIFPWVLHHFLLVLERRGGPRVALKLVVLSAILVLAHAMIAAGFFISMTVMAATWTVVGGLRVRDVARGVLFIFAGIFSVAWWLLPALSGGIVGVDASAVTGSIDYFPIETSFNPMLRLANPEVFYWGIALVPIMLWIVLSWKHRSGLARAAFCAGSVLIMATTVAFSPIYNALPLHHLLWPLYLASAAPGMFFLAVFLPATGGVARNRKVALVALVVVATLLVADAVPSLRLVSTRPLPTGIERIARQLPPVEEGWRVATLDLSAFGSVAPHRFGDDNRREQVFGWAWQGAATADNIVWLNRSLIGKWWTFTFDRLIELGATSVVVRRSIVEEDLDEVLETAAGLGFYERWRSGEALLLVRDQTPYALHTSYKALGIGRHTTNFAMMFPALEVGGNAHVDEYRLQDLLRYETVVVSGATWKDKRKAEAVLWAYVKEGGRVVIDLQGLPDDVLSRRPSLFGVSGEPVNIYSRLVGHTRDGDQHVFDMFDSTHYPWKAVSPQGLDSTELFFFHYGEESALIGTKKVEGNDVWFLGGNLAYHAFLTRDELALSTLAEVLRIEPEELPVRQEIPLVGYKADSSGYRFSMSVPKDVGGSILTIPVAYRHNMKVALNGEVRPHSSKHNLISIVAEPGQVFATLEPKVPVETAYGFGLSALALGAFYGTVFRRKRGAKHDTQQHSHSASGSAV